LGRDSPVSNRCRPQPSARWRLDEQTFRFENPNKIGTLTMLARWCGDVHSRGETRMRKIVLTLAALAAFGIALPAATTQPASAETVVIKKDRGHHYGWRNRDRDRVVIMKRHHREYREHRGATVGVQVR
jgi:hypothetical protein